MNPSNTQSPLAIVWPTGTQAFTALPYLIHIPLFPPDLPPIHHQWQWRPAAPQVGHRLLCQTQEESLVLEWVADSTPPQSLQPGQINISEGLPALALVLKNWLARRHYHLQVLPEGLWTIRYQESAALGQLELQDLGGFTTGAIDIQLPFSPLPDWYRQGKELSLLTHVRYGHSSQWVAGDSQNLQEVWPQIKPISIAFNPIFDGLAAIRQWRSVQPWPIETSTLPQVAIAKQAMVQAAYSLLLRDYRSQTVPIPLADTGIVSWVGKALQPGDWDSIQPSEQGQSQCLLLEQKARILYKQAPWPAALGVYISDDAGRYPMAEVGCTFFAVHYGQGLSPSTTELADFPSEGDTGVKQVIWRYHLPAGGYDKASLFLTDRQQIELLDEEDALFSLSSQVGEFLAVRRVNCFGVTEQWVFPILKGTLPQSYFTQSLTAVQCQDLRALVAAHWQEDTPIFWASSLSGELGFREGWLSVKWVESSLYHADEIAAIQIYNHRKDRNLGL